MKSKLLIPSTRAAYYAMRRAYRIANRDLLGMDNWRMCTELLTAGRSLTGSWEPFARIAPRNSLMDTCDPVYRPNTRNFVCYRPKVWAACTRFLARCA